MSIDIYRTKVMPTRPCRYSLSLQEGAVYADFDLEDETIYLRRISFDGYGCCDIEDLVRKMSVDDSKRFIQLVEADKIDEEELTQVLKNYFKDNSDVIWNDALTDHKLI